MISQTLLNTFKLIGPMSAELESRLNDVFFERIVQKRDFLLQKGEYCNQVYYIEQGLFRYFHHVPGYDGKPKIACSWFLKEDDFILSPYSWYLNKRSNEYIQALEDSLVYGVSRDDLEKLYRDFPDMNARGRILTEKYYVMNEVRLFEIRLRSAYERYVMFHEKNKDLIKRVPISYIASYLDLSRESIHKVRLSYKLAGGDVDDYFDIKDEEDTPIAYDKNEY